MNTLLCLIVKPEQRDPNKPSRSYRYDARLEGEDRVLATHIAPFCAAARVLIGEGHDPNVLLTMRHEGSETESVRAKLGIAAGLTVRDSEGRSLPQFATWRPFSDAPQTHAGSEIPAMNGRPGIRRRRTSAAVLPKAA